MSPGHETGGPSVRPGAGVIIGRETGVAFGCDLTDNDPARRPENSWRSHVHLLFGNWINEIYQTTPFDPGTIGRIPAPALESL